MSDSESLLRWARRQSRQAPEAGDSAPARSPAPPPPQLPPPPQGMGWAYSEAHGYVLIQLAPPPPPRQPQQGGLILPPTREQAPAGYPPGYVGAAVPPGPGNVIPFRHRSCQLVRPGNRDTYADFLAGVPDIAPGSSFAYMNDGLAPDEAEIAGLPEMSPQAPVNPYTQIHDNPALDAFGPRGVAHRAVAPLAELSSTTPAGGGGDPDPSAA